MAEEQDDIDLIEGFETVPREKAYDYFQAPDYEVIEGIYDDPEPGFVVPGGQFVSDPEADVAAVEEAEQSISHTYFDCDDNVVVKYLVLKGAGHNISRYYSSLWNDVWDFFSSHD